MNLGLVVGELSEPALARSLHEECLTFISEVGDRRMTANCLCCLGELAQRAGDQSRAHSLFAESLAILRDLGDKYLMRYLLLNLGTASLTLVDIAQASACYLECLELSRDVKTPGHILNCLEGLSIVALKQRHWNRGGQLWGAAEALRCALNAERDPLHCQLHSRAVPAGAAIADARAYETAVETGRSLSEEEAVALALSPWN